MFQQGGDRYMLYHQIKLKIINQYGKPENQERLTKFMDSLRRWMDTGPLLVPRLQFLIEFKWKRKIHSESFLLGCHKTVKKQKKFFNAQYESCKLSCKVRYLGQNEDCNPGDSISDNSEKLIQRGNGERSVYMWFWWRENTCNQVHILQEDFY